MSAVEDTRKVLPDSSAPELRSIAARLDALEARMAQQDQQRQRDKDDILRAIASIADYNSLSNRLARLEAERSEKPIQH